MANDLFAPPTSNELQESSVPSENTDYSSMADDFLKPIRQVESNNGKNTNHRMIESGMHKGHRAIGDYGLMPLTVNEVVNRSGDKELEPLLGMGPEEKKKYLEDNPGMQHKVAKNLAELVLKNNNGDFKKAAYAWNQGHNLDPDTIEDRDYKSHDYVKKFEKAAGRKVAESGDLFAAPSPEELKQLQTSTPKPIQQPTQETPSNYNELESGTRGAIQGVTGGFRDEGAGAIASPVGAVKELLNKFGSNFSDEDVQKYLNERNLSRQMDEDAKKANPKSFIAGNIGGAVASSFIPGLGATSIPKIAGLGALTGLGYSNAEDLKGAAIDTAVGGGLGAGAGYLGQVVGKGLTSAATSSRAAKAATKALGGSSEDIAAGKAALEEGVLPFFGGAQGTEKAITSKIGDIEKNIVQPTLNDVSSNAGLQNVVGGRPPLSDIVDDLATKFKAGFKSSDAAQVGKLIDNDAAYWGKQLDAAKGNPKKLNELRKAIDFQGKRIQKTMFQSDVDLKPRAEFYSELRDTVNSELRDIAGQVSTGAGKDIEQAMGRQSKLIKAQNLAGNLVEKDFEKVPGEINIKNMGVEGAGAVASILGHPGIGIPTMAMGAAKIAAEKATGQPIGRLANIASARTQNALANTSVGKGVLKTGEVLTKLGSKAIQSSGVQSGIQSLYTASSPQIKQVANTLSQTPNSKNIGEALNRAIESGDEQAKNKIIFAAEQRPDTREILRSLMGATQTQPTEE